MFVARSGAFYMVWSVVFFSIAHALVKAVPHLPFFQLAFLRQLIALILCLIPLLYLKISPWGHQKRMLIARGVAGSLALTTYFYSLQNMPLASAVSIQYLSPLLTLLFAHWLLKEKSSRLQAALFVICFLAVLMIRGFDDRISNEALVVSLFSVLASALAYTSVRALRGGDHQLVIVFYFSIVSLPLLAPWSIVQWESLQDLDWIVILGIGGLTWLAQVAMTISFQKSPASEVAIYNNLGIIFALIIGYLFFDETFRLESLIGMFIILVSLLISNYTVTPRV